MGRPANCMGDLFSSLATLGWRAPGSAITVSHALCLDCKSGWEQTGKGSTHHSQMFTSIPSSRFQQRFPIRNSGIGISIKSTNLNRSKPGGMP